ncbi:MAG: NfeD family protein [Desulfovibrio sp.]|nr:NfeD family protein [Desulfovibrio sp.]MCA1986702.1 NfeD family protein [Desulfovibrio sp.]
MSAWLIWFLVGIGFLILELILPGFIVIFFCMGAWVAMLAVLVAPEMATAWQVSLFVAASLASLFTLRKWGMKTFGGRSEVSEDARIDDKIGRPAVVTQAIYPPATGEVKCLGSFWRAVADQPIGVGVPVIIEAVASGDGLTFKVKPAA